jgi:hypothetical protein
MSNIETHESRAAAVAIWALMESTRDVGMVASTIGA